MSIKECTISLISDILYSLDKYKYTIHFKDYKIYNEHYYIL